MALKSPNTNNLDYPHKLLIEEAADAHSQLYSVIESFKDSNLKFRLPNSENRSIVEMLSHALCTQLCFYTKELVLGQKDKCRCKTPKTINEALNSIQQNLDEISKIWTNIPVEELQKEFKTEWRQVMTKELALLQSVEHMMYHIGEICFLSGLRGFYKGILG